MSGDGVSRFLPTAIETVKEAIKKDNEKKSGTVEYVSREGAAAAGDSTKVPRLILEF